MEGKNAAYAFMHKMLHKYAHLGVKICTYCTIDRCDFCAICRKLRKFKKTLAYLFKKCYNIIIKTSKTVIGGYQNG